MTSGERLIEDHKRLLKADVVEPERTVVAIEHALVTLQFAAIFAESAEFVKGLDRLMYEVQSVRGKGV